MKIGPAIPTQVIPSVERAALSSRVVAREFQSLVTEGAKFQIAGSAKRDHNQLFAKGLTPKHKIELFDTTFYLTNVRQIPELRFLLAYVVQRNPKGRATISPRIFYKDLSLAWRSASHYSFDSEGDFWVGKGDIRDEVEDGEEIVVSQESTTDLPLEMQTAVEQLIGFTRKPKGNLNILDLVLRRSPSNRVEPYADFTTPRAKAMSNPENLINNGKTVAFFKKPNDPKSLIFAHGYEPDFRSGIVEKSKFKSRMYGGKLSRYRILAKNRRIQYFFLAGPKHVWIIPPQATTTELSSYGVRTVDVIADDDLFIPGYEYHYWDTTNGTKELYSQIPPGFVGEECPFDDAKSDASPWLNELPVIKKFRQDILGRRS